MQPSRLLCPVFPIPSIRRAMMTLTKTHTHKMPSMQPSPPKYPNCILSHAQRMKSSRMQMRNDLSPFLWGKKTKKERRTKTQGGMVLCYERPPSRPSVRKKKTPKPKPKLTPVKCKSTHPKMHQEHQEISVKCYSLPAGNKGLSRVCECCRISKHRIGKCTKYGRCGEKSEVVVVVGVVEKEVRKKRKPSRTCGISTRGSKHACMRAGLRHKNFKVRSKNRTAAESGLGKKAVVVRSSKGGFVREAIHPVVEALTPTSRVESGCRRSRTAFQEEGPHFHRVFLRGCNSPNTVLCLETQPAGTDCLVSVYTCTCAPFPKGPR
jgi:hypothetical protein